MGIMKMLVVTFFYPSFLFWMSRINAMTFKSFCRTITIKNEKMARILIAYKNTWGIATSIDKRNKMSIKGIISYILFFIEICFVLYDWWIFINTGVAENCSIEKNYIIMSIFFYLIALSTNIVEGDKFKKGKLY